MNRLYPNNWPVYVFVALSMALVIFSQVVNIMDDGSSVWNVILMVFSSIVLLGSFVGIIYRVMHPTIKR